MKYQTTGDLHLRVSPSTDGAIVQTIPAGTTLESDGKPPWASVVLADGTTGYCASKYLQLTVDGAAHFAVGQPNPADGENTIAVRRAIRDAFGGGARGEPLQCTEYVQFRVKEVLGIDIIWPVSSGRNGGAWWKIFQEAGKYRVSLEPAACGAMCFTAGISADHAVNAIGHVAFVETVLPDRSIRISEANWPHGGIYNERALREGQWRDKYQARFVSFV